MQQTVPLSSLVQSRANRRKTYKPGSIEGLALSMATDGQLQQLVVKCRRGDKFEVLAGERRRRALKLREERGEIAPDHPVTVEVRHGLSALEAMRISLVENVQREDMDAIDEAESFAAMLATAAKLEDIATQTGLHLSTIKRRLALDTLSDEAKAAVRAGEVGLAIAEALTLGSHDDQRAFLDALASGDAWTDAADLRAYFTAQRPTVALAAFPLETYTGTFTTDLFGAAETTYFDDAEQFDRLQREAIQRIAAEREEAGAAFVEVIEASHLNRWHYEPAEDGEPGGTVILLTPSGRVDIHDGLARNAEVRPEVIEATRPAPVPGGPKLRPEYATPLVRYIGAHRTAAVQAVASGQPRKVMEIACVQMLANAARHRIEVHPALDFLAKGTTDSPAYDRLEAEAGRLLGLLGLEAAESEPAWRRLSRSYQDPRDLYAAVQALSEEQLTALHCWLVVASFGQDELDRLDDAESFASALAGDLGVDMAAWWRPDAVFLAGRKQSQLVEIALESGAFSSRTWLAKQKKGELVPALAKHFAVTRGRDDDPNQAVRTGATWLPEAMRFAPIAEAEPGESEVPAEADRPQAEQPEPLAA